MSSVPTPTHAELTLLNLLWKRGPSTVHNLIDAMPARAIGYTTVLKTLQIMDAKGLVGRDSSRRPHVFEAAIEQTATQRSMVGRLADRAFQGSIASLVLNALGSGRSSKAELAEIRAMLDRLAGDD
ncbi:MAG: BlaI family penicillinase repressor [Myxococcota bacterium]|jgi:BlaI family penicillinase repressor